MNVADELTAAIARHLNETGRPPDAITLRQADYEQLLDELLPEGRDRYPFVLRFHGVSIRVARS